MISERRESLQPRENIRLLFATAEVVIHENAKVLLDKVGANNEFLLTNDQLVVSRREGLLPNDFENPEKKKNFEAKKFLSGDYTVYDKKNGLSNYSAMYVRKNDNIVIAGAQIWEQKSFPTINELNSGIIKVARTLLLSREDNWMGSISFHDIAYSDDGLRNIGESECAISSLNNSLPSEKNPSEVMRSISHQIKLINQQVGLKYNVAFGNPIKKFPDLKP